MVGQKGIVWLCLLRSAVASVSVPCLVEPSHRRARVAFCFPLLGSEIRLWSSADGICDLSTKPWLWLVVLRVGGHQAEISQPHRSSSSVYPGRPSSSPVAIRGSATCEKAVDLPGSF
ncbi:hypothetical protein GQ53DRAFT_518625 [Thozetella sp. PMI_491]|nr:hypothetical protein GQ53DRAFT_518625 [Thozetella sp. PMI_491]